MFDNINKIAIFSDIHFGHTKDSVTKLRIAAQFVKWFRDECIKRDIELIVFCGDWFHNRNSISIITSNIAYMYLKELTKAAPVIMIVGNHDIHYKTTNKVCSLTPLREIPNVTIIEKNTDINIGGRDCLLSPWQADLTKIDKVYDFAFGHFDFNGAALYAYTHDDADYSMSDISKLAPLVFTGHFHINKEYPSTDGKIVSIGSPVELTWGDIDNTKGFYTLDMKSREYKLVKNSISPIHKKYFWSKLQSGVQKLSESEIKNNYIKLVVDDKYEFEKVIKTLTAINDFKPIRPSEPEFIYSMFGSLLDVEDIDADELTMNMSVLDYILKFIEKLPDDMFVEIERDVLMDYARRYYVTATNGST